VDWIHLAQERVQWLAFVNTVMNDEYCLLGSNAVQIGKTSLAFRRNVLPSPQEFKS
jgi:hypothetical protein